MERKLHPVIEFLIISVITLAGTLLSAFISAQVLSGKNYADISTTVRIFGLINDIIPFVASLICFKLIENREKCLLKTIIVVLCISVFYKYIYTLITIFVGRYGLNAIAKLSAVTPFVIPVIKSAMITAFVNVFNLPATEAFAYDKKMSCGMVNHILLLLFTFGIWRLVWIYRVTKYLNCIEDEENRNPATKLLLCMFVPFYSVYWTYISARRVDKLAKSVDIISDLTIACLILELFAPIFPPILMQDKINKIISTESYTL